ncbi:MAG TPA: glucokinase [Caulobacteraceae bacterium]
MNRPVQSGLRLVGDVGGTNVRFALADTSGAAPRISDAESYRCADFPGLEAAIEHYLSMMNTRGPRPHAAVVAVAGPVDNGVAVLTNGRWRMSNTGLQAAGFSAARLINDYTALALAVRRLGPDDLGALGDADSPAEGKTIALVGAGTGLGVAAAVRADGVEVIATAEGGHIGFAPVDETEVEILRALNGVFGRVSLERILSGPGLVSLRWALGRIAGQEVEPITPEEVVARAMSGQDPLCAQTLDRFCAIYGSAAGDMALVYGALGGVYLGGGIAPRILAWLRKSEFRARFEAKGRFAGYLAPIATKVIVHPYAALLGAADAALPLKSAVPAT